jgi:hypothetical protein
MTPIDPLNSHPLSSPNHKSISLIRRHPFRVTKSFARLVFSLIQASQRKKFDDPRLGINGTYRTIDTTLVVNSISKRIGESPP